LNSEIFSGISLLLSVNSSSRGGEKMAKTGYLHPTVMVTNPDGTRLEICPQNILSCVADDIYKKEKYPKGKKVSVTFTTFVVIVKVNGKEVARFKRE
jgi:hypothetical protein